MLNENVGANKNDYCLKINQFQLKFTARIIPLPVSLNEKNI
jgi:hypothetical protein